MLTNKSVDSEWRSPSTKWAHKSNCYDSEGKQECCCPLRESVDLYNQSVSEVGLADRTEET